MPSYIADFLRFITEEKKLFLQFTATVTFVSVWKIMRDNGLRRKMIKFKKNDYYYQDTVLLLSTSDM
jgi:hypothetical protein